MHSSIQDRRNAIGEICRRYGVTRLEVFGSAARAVDFDSDRSDVDFLVDFGGKPLTLAAYLDLKEDLEALLGRSVDLIERQAIEQSRNYIRRQNILEDAKVVYAA